jgi:Asp-tRNA(Asn)/Glu-tRNA(Gln) amidotransferase C subunit
VDLSEADLGRLLGLSLIEIREKKDQEKMLLDLKKTLDYFSVLATVETEKVVPSFSGHSEDLIDNFEDKKKRVEPELLSNKKGEYIKGPKIF